MNKTSSLCGRPAGRKKTAKIEVVIAPEIKERFMNIISIEGKTALSEIRCWIRKYIKEMNTDTL